MKSMYYELESGKTVSEPNLWLISLTEGASPAKLKG